MLSFAVQSPLSDCIHICLHRVKCCFFNINLKIWNDGSILEFPILDEINFDFRVISLIVSF